MTERKTSEAPRKVYKVLTERKTSEAPRKVYKVLTERKTSEAPRKVYKVLTERKTSEAPRKVYKVLTGKELLGELPSSKTQHRFGAEMKKLARQQVKDAISKEENTSQKPAVILPRWTFRHRTINT